MFIGEAWSMAGLAPQFKSVNINVQLNISLDLTLAYFIEWHLCQPESTWRNQTYDKFISARFFLAAAAEEYHRLSDMSHCIWSSKAIRL